MTNEDRDLLFSLRQQQAELQQMLHRLTAQLTDLESRTGVSVAELALPPIPPEAFLPPIPQPAAPVELPPVPAAPAGHVDLPPVPAAAPRAAQLSPESHLGSWITRLGVGFILLFLALCASWFNFEFHLNSRIGAVGKICFLGLIGALALFAGQRRDPPRSGKSFIGRALVCTGLAILYLACFAAHIRLTPSGGPVLGELLLLWWTAYTLVLARHRQSQALGTLGIILGFVSTSLGTAAWFTLGANLFLTAAAAAFLLLDGWVALATCGVIGAYLTLFHRLIFDSSGDLVLDTSRTLPFAPPAIYLIGAWVLYTTAIILTPSPSFAGLKRFVFTSLNNAAFAFLLALTAYIAGYGIGAIGWTLFDTGMALLIVSRFAGFAVHDPAELMGVYAAQGLAVLTAGIIVVFTGVTRAVLLLLETLFFGIAGAFAGDRILTISTYAAGFFATIFSIWQIAIFAHHPWLLGLGGAFIMLISAWSSRSEVRHSPVARSSVVMSTSCYCLLALGLIFAALSSELTDASLPVALALGALVLTFAIYHFSIFELPSLAQILMLAALILVLFPVETGEELPGWSILAVGLATLILATWWARQRTTIPGAWVGPLLYLYALVLTYLAVITVRPFLDAQGWMVAASLLSAIFLAYGAVLRVWSLAIAGQILLVLSLYHFFLPPQSEVYPWAGWAAAIPVLVTFLAARAAHEWILLSPEISADTRATASFVAYLYKLVALAGLMRWTFGIVPPSVQMAAFLFFAAFLLAANVRRPDTFGARCSLLLSATGIYLCLAHSVPIGSTLNAFAVLLFLLQLPLLGRHSPLAFMKLESWLLTIAAVLTGWFFVSLWTWPAPAGLHSHLSLAWAVYALLLFVIGLASGQGNLRWFGLLVLVATMFRVLCVDLWSLSGGVRVLTVFLLAIITLGIGLSLILRGDMASEHPPRNL